MYLTFERKNRVNISNFSQTEDLVTGKIDPADLPGNIAELFLKYENLVNIQCFPEVDRLDQEIDSLDVEVVLDEEKIISDLENLQIYPSTGSVSFNVKE